MDAEARISVVMDGWVIVLTVVYGDGVVVVDR
jgi:hypothetical protein